MKNLFVYYKKCLLRLIALLATSVLTLAASAQTATLPKNLASPNAANLGTYGKIPVSYFTGTPAIEVPIYEFVESDISVPITLSYHPANVKPNTHPGWVGLGWTLLCGGAITRIQNGFADEHQASKKDIGFYATYGKLNTSDWNSSSKLFGYGKGLLYETPQYEVMADKFIFNVNGYSGEFYLDHTGKWVVISDHKITVEFDANLGFIKTDRLRASIKSKIPPTAQDLFQRYFHQFALAMPDGTRYVFGGDDAVEYSVPYRSQRQGFVIPTTWYLKEIKSPLGNKVTFKYEPKALICTISNSYSYFKIDRKATGNGFLDVDCSKEVDQTSRTPASGYLIFPVYLSSIEGKTTIIEFKSSASKELRYSESDLRPNPLHESENDVFTYFKNTSELQWQQLDNVIVKRNKDQFVKKFNLTYTSDSNKRLKLLSFQELGLNSQGGITLSKPSYQFIYQQTPLPPNYSSDQVDHWGFYNGYNFSNFKPANRSQWIDQYPTTREPDQTGTFQTAEMINKIIYPTGASTTFDFEPHQYAKTVELSRVDLSSHSNKKAGGVRIKRVTNTPLVGVPDIRNFYYVRGYSSTVTLTTLTSSGILGGKNQYWWPSYKGKDLDNNIYTYDLFSSGSLLPFGYNSQGSHIGYSEVIEAQGNNYGYTRYTYTNFDTDLWGQSHMDEKAINNIDAERSVYSPYTSKALERGKLTSTEVRASNNNLASLSKIKYAKSSENYLRTVESSHFDVCSNVTASAQTYFGTAYKTYVYEFRPSQSEERVYDPSGSSYAVTFTDYKYANPKHKQLTQRIVKDSENRTHTTDYSYAEDFTGSDANLYGSNLLRAKHMHTQVLTQTDKVGTAVVSKGINYFKAQSDRVVNYRSDYYPTGSGASTQTEYLYSDLGNLLEEKQLGGTAGNYTVSYLWGYNQTLPIAKIEGASYSTVTSKLSSTDLTALQGTALTDQQIRDKLTPLRNISGALVNVYTHVPLIGLSSVTSPNGLITTYQYDALGRLQYIKDHSGRYTDQYQYHHYSQAHP